MADYRYVVYSSLSQAAIDELPLTDVSYTIGLNGIGGGNAKISVDDPKATPYLIKTLSREMCVWRDGIPVQMGPITQVTPSLRDRSVTIGWSSPWYWLQRRSNELNLVYDKGTDAGAAVKDMVSVALAKAPGGDVGIAISSAYPAKTYKLPATLNYPLTSTDKVGAMVEKIGSQYPGFDFDIVLAPSQTQTVNRYFQIFSPFKGTTVNRVITAASISDASFTEDGTAAFTRVTEISDATEDNKIFVVRQNSQQLRSGAVPMVEEIFSRDTSTGGTIDQLKTWADGDLFLHKWPHTTYSFSYRPSAALPFGFVQPGDTLPLNLPVGNFTLSGNLRVASYEVSVDEGGGESIALSFNDPIDADG